MKGRLARAPFAVVPALLLLGGMEGLARLAPAPSPSSLVHADGGDRAILLEGNPYLGWELKPGSRVEAGGALVTVNQQRFRGPDRPKKTRARALALGDSSIYGFGVADSIVFTGQLEDRSPVDFVNGGVPGYSSFQALNLLALRGLDLDPDLLIVGTLWSDNNFDSFVDRELLLGSDGVNLRYVLSARSGLLNWLEYLALYQRSSSRFGKVGWMTQTTPAGPRRVPIQDYAANLARFCEIMAERKGGVLFLMLPNREDLSPTVSAPPWTPYREVMRQTATACGAPLLDLPALFSASGASPSQMFMDEMHPNINGHTLIAQQLQALLTSLSWPARPITVHAPAAPVEVADTFEGQAEKWFGGARKSGNSPSGSGGAGPSPGPHPPGPSPSAPAPSHTQPPPGPPPHPTTGPTPPAPL